MQIQYKSGESIGLGVAYDACFNSCILYDNFHGMHGIPMDTHASILSSNLPTTVSGNNGNRKFGNPQDDPAVGAKCCKKLQNIRHSLFCHGLEMSGGGGRNGTIVSRTTRETRHRLLGCTTRKHDFDSMAHAYTNHSKTFGGGDRFHHRWCFRNSM